MDTSCNSAINETVDPERTIADLERAADFACVEYLRLEMEHCRIVAGMRELKSPSECGPMQDRLHSLERVLIPQARAKFGEAKLAHLQEKLVR